MKKWSEVKSLSRVQLFVTPWTIKSIKFLGQNTGVGSFPFSRVSSQPRDWTQVSHIVGRFFTSWATREAQELMEWVAYAFSSGSSWPRNQTRVSCMAGKFLTNWAIREGLPNWCDPYWFPFYWYIGRSVIKIVNAVQRGEKREHKGSLVWGVGGRLGSRDMGISYAWDWDLLPS